MRLPSILLLVSSAVFASHVAATASESVSVPNASQGDSVGHTKATHQLRKAVREEERSPPPVKQADLEMLRGLVQKANMPSISVDKIKKTQNPAYFQGLSTLYEMLKAKFGGDKLDTVLALAETHFISEDDKPLRDLFNYILSERKRSKQKFATMLKTRSHPVVHAESSSRLTAAEQDVLQKLRSVVQEVDLPFIPADGIQPENYHQAFFRGLSTLFQKLKVEFGTNEELDSALKLAAEHFVSEEDKPLREHLASIRAGRQGLEDDELQKALRALSGEITRPKSPDPQVVLQKLRSLVGDPDLPSISRPVDKMLEDGIPESYFYETLILDQKLKEMFPTDKDMKIMSDLVTQLMDREDGQHEPVLVHVAAYFKMKDEVGTADFQKAVWKEVKKRLNLESDDD